MAALPEHGLDSYYLDPQEGFFRGTLNKVSRDPDVSSGKSFVLNESF